MGPLEPLITPASVDEVRPATSGRLRLAHSIVDWIRRVAPGGALSELLAQPPSSAPVDVAGSDTSTEVSPEELEHTVGAAVLGLLLSPAWVHRRVDRVTFVDAATVLRQMSVDFTLPHTVLIDELRRLRPGLVPVATLVKRDLARFSLWDESRDALPMLTTGQNAWYAGAVLVAIARGFALDKGLVLDSVVLEAFRRVASEGEESASIVLRCLRSGFDANADLLDRLGPPNQDPRRSPLPLDRRPTRDIVDGLRPHEAATRALFEASPLVGQLASELARQFVVLTVLGEDERRRIVKFSYEEPPSAYRPHVGWFRRFLARPFSEILVAFSWWHKTITLDSVPIGTADSYHIEIEAPPDIEILGARLTARDPRRDDPPVRVQSTRTERQRVHLKVAGQPRAVRGPVWVQLRPVRAGFLRSAVVLGGVVAALLWIGQSRLTEISSKADVPGAILLLVPTVLVAVLLRPGEHAMVSRMLAGVRLLALGSAGCALVAAGAIAGGYQNQDEAHVWKDAKWIATGIAAALLLSYFLPYCSPLAARGAIWTQDRVAGIWAKLKHRRKGSDPGAKL